MMWRNVRDRVLGDAAIRARIARWPFGRRIAAGHARRLFGTVAGFVESQLLLAALELGVFEQLAAGPRDWASIVALPPRGGDALLQGLIAAGLVERRGALVALTVDGLVVASEPGLQALIAHNRLLYADLADPVAMLAGTANPGAIARFWPYAGAGGEPAAYGALMAASQRLLVADVLDAVRWPGLGHVMDVGGGDGAFVTALRARHPRLALTLVDLPAVVAGLDLAQERIAVAGVAADAPLPTGARAVTLLRLLHDLDDGAAAALLARVAAALPPGGTVIVAEPMARPGRDPQTAYFAAYFAAMRSGRLRSPPAIGELLHTAGFAQVRRAAASPLVTVLAARRV